MVRTLMIQGTGSDVGKSLIVAGLCRVLTQRGLRVLPFKPQNMSNNAAVTEDGGEIGRAQWLQALACGTEPSVHMNPILLKPESDGVSQLVIQGKRVAQLPAGQFQSRKAEMLQAVHQSFRILQEQCDFIVVEGAGSPAEINLRQGDIANMGFAAPLGIPVLLVADIDRGGAVASLVGTHAVLDEVDRACIRGFIINKFRGDMSLFASAAHMIEDRTGWAHLGTLPYLEQLTLLPKEDAFSLKPQASGQKKSIRIVVPRLAHISNLDDFDPLRAEEDVEVIFVHAGEMLPEADLIIIPGTKSTLSDLYFLRAQGWDIDILAHARRGGRVLGICGGYQMLGRVLSDPQGVDGTPGQAAGLALLDVETEFADDKQLETWHGACLRTHLPVEGYHMHMGRTSGLDCTRPMFTREGAQSADGRIQGCYVHGVFASDAWRQSFLASLRSRDASLLSYRALIEQRLDMLAQEIKAHLDIEWMLEMAKTPLQSAAA